MYTVLTMPSQAFPFGSAWAINFPGSRDRFPLCGSSTAHPQTLLPPRRADLVVAEMLRCGTYRRPRQATVGTRRIADFGFQEDLREYDWHPRVLTALVPGICKYGDRDLHMGWAMALLD